MRNWTTLELLALSVAQLLSLEAEVAGSLASLAFGSPERNAALNLLARIRAAIIARRRACWRPTSRPTL